jgi:superfamily II DNA or RNA helicase
MQASEIKAGLAVFHTANPGRIGVLTGNQLDAMCLMAEVDWGSGGAEFVDVELLEMRGGAKLQDAAACVRDRRYGTLDDLRRRITFEKLRGTLTDVVYSMKTAEIDFYPHQFKPALRFIESASNRLLIADEVGLGKTIEAGLIWTEWQARNRARRLLVLCTPTLVPKWMDEFRDKFQIMAEATSPADLLDHLDRFQRRGANTSFVLVASYHALRPRAEERLLLDELDKAEGADEARYRSMPTRVELLQRIRVQGDHAVQTDTPPFLDMVVFDEAHWMKNTASATYHLGELLSTSAAATLCLSATPIHNESRDLYALLRLIDPEVFRDQYVFDLLRSRNRPIVDLQRALSRHAWTPREVRPLLESIDPPSARVPIAAMLDGFDGSPRMRVEIRHQVEQMNLLAAFINRTRKVDVIENRVIRVPVTLPVTFSEKEMLFYNMVLRTVRASVRRQGGRSTSFHLIHPALAMSSALPVVAQSVRDGRWGGFEEMTLLADDVGEDWDLDRTDWPAAAEVAELAQHDFERNDSKYRELLRALRQIAAGKSLAADSGATVATSNSDQVVVFAFFKATIRYLARRLAADGLTCSIVTGDVANGQERTRVFDDFRAGRTRILLCSEVGAEGIDLQQARIVVNYDLPWNPMRVEQRIGRIDRIGQKAPSIVIINFHIRDTIDGSIYAHLYNKIGIFESSIGALEGILGTEISKLTGEIFREELTADQVAERVARTADAVCERSKQEQILEEQTGALIAFQDLLSERIGESQRLGRYIRPAELRLQVTDFFARHYTGDEVCGILPDNPEPGCVELTLGFKAVRDLEDYCTREELPWPNGFGRHGSPTRLTFDPAVYHSLRARHRTLQLVNHLHPLLRWITDVDQAKTNDWHKVSALSLQTSSNAPGDYFYLIHRLTFDGITRRDAFVYIIKHLDTGRVFDGVEAERMLGEALERGESLFPRDIPDLTAVLNELKKAVAQELGRQKIAFDSGQDQKLDLRRRQVTAHFDRRIESQKRRIETAVLTGTAPGAVAGFRKTLANLERLRASQLERLDFKVALRKHTFSEVACGFLKVEPASPSTPCPAIS